MDVLIGKTLSHYRIIERIGAGGMGVVYRAHDERLGRDVAVKVLPSGALADEASRRHFRKEALTLSKLNHPHVATIYDFDTDDGVDFLVMEYVSGVSLDEKLASGALSEKEVARLGSQLAQGLTAAHGEGIIHRDLKPGNLRVTTDSRLKILDFGLAKALHPGRLDLTATTTETGVIAGTLPYMSPEQLRGEKPDERSDIYSAGVVLYEAATGRRAFPQVQVHQLIEAILREAPPAPRLLNRQISPALDGIIVKAMDKDPDFRYHAARELGVDLERLTVPVLRTQPRREQAPPGRRALIAGAAFIAIAVLSLFVWKPGLLHERTSGPMKERQLTSGSGGVIAASISPDGKYVAYADSTAIRVRQIQTGETSAFQVPKGAALEEQSLSWFPDGSKLLVCLVRGEDSSLWAMSLLGGRWRRIGDGSSQGAVSPDGTQIATWVGQDSILFMQADGGDARTVAVGGNRPVYVSDLGWSPDGRRLAFLKSEFYGSKRILNSSFRTWSVGEGRETILIPHGALVIPGGATGSGCCWLPDGRVIFAQTEPPPNTSDSNLWEVRVDPRNGKAIGKPKRLTNWLGSFVTGLSATADGKRLSFIRNHIQTDIYTAELDPGGHALRRPARLTFDDRNDYAPVWTPDSRSIIFASNRTGTSHLYRQQLKEHDAVAITTGVDQEGAPQVTPDGKWILYRASSASDSAIARRLMRIPTSGGPPEVVLESKTRMDFLCSSQKGGRCLLRETYPAGAVFSDLDPLAGRGRELYRAEAGKVIDVWSLSSDGSRIAAISFFDKEVKIVSLVDGRTTDLKLPAFAQRVAWSATGDALFFSERSGDETSIGRLDLKGSIRVLKRWNLQDCSWVGVGSPSPDGRRLAFLEISQEKNAWMLEGF